MPLLTLFPSLRAIDKQVRQDDCPFTANLLPHAVEIKLVLVNVWKTNLKNYKAGKAYSFCESHMTLEWLKKMSLSQFVPN